MVETQSPTVIIVSVIFAVFIFAALSLRFWARAVLVKQIGTDDGESFFFFFFFLALSLFLSRNAGLYKDLKEERAL